MAKNNRNFNDRRNNDNNRYDNRGYERKSYSNFNKKPSYSKFEKRPSNVTKNIALGSSSYYDTKLDQLTDLIMSIPFDKISIQVTMPKSEIYGNDDARGFVVVGYVQGFSMSNGFKVTILGKYAELIELDKTMVVKVRTDRETGDIKMITAFTMESVEPIDLSFDEFEDEEDPVEVNTEDTAPSEPVVEDTVVEEASTVEEVVTEE